MNCEDCKSKGCIDTTCRTCWPKDDMETFNKPMGVMIGSSEPTEFINCTFTNADTEELPRSKDDKSDVAEVNALLAGDLKELPRVKNYIDSKGMA